MFHRIQQYPLMDANGRWYRPRAYGDAQPDATWDGWLVFFPLDGTAAIAPPGPDTTQRTFDALAVWAAGLRPVYLEGALARAIAVEEEVPVISQLAVAEYEALEDAERLEIAAAVKRTAADLDDAAASAALADAARLRRERAATEEAMAATEEAVATLEADAYEQEARNARAVAAEAAARRRAVSADAAPRSRKQSPASKKKCDLVERSSPEREVHFRLRLWRHERQESERGQSWRQRVFAVHARTSRLAVPLRRN